MFLLEIVLIEETKYLPDINKKGQHNKKYKKQ
jgi:hypothetical protein